jgi:hypothetical protein
MAVYTKISSLYLGKFVGLILAAHDRLILAYGLRIKISSLYLGKFVGLSTTVQFNCGRSFGKMYLGIFSFVSSLVHLTH